MPRVERHVVAAPNERLQGLANTRSAVPPASAPAAHSPNRVIHDGSPGGSGALPRLASPVRLPDHRFNVENAQMPQPQSAIEPGRGDVPIYPVNAKGLPNPTLREPDTAKQARG